MNYLVPLTTLALLFVANAQAGDRDTCDYPKCSPSDYLAIWPIAKADCDTINESSCEYRWSPPPEVYLDCYYHYYSYACQVWPQGPELSYAWSSSGYLSNPTPASGSEAWVDCTGPVSPPRGGSIAVTVFGPQGYSRTTAVSVSCRNDEIP